MCKQLLREPWLTALYLPLSHSNPLQVAALDSYFHTLSLVAGFLSCVLFIFQGFIRTWSFSSFFFPSQFQAIFSFLFFFLALRVWKLSCLQAWVMGNDDGLHHLSDPGPTCFQMCAFAGWINGVEEDPRESGPSHYCAGSPWFPTHPSFQEPEMFYFEVKRNSAQTLLPGVPEVTAPHRKTRLLLPSM